jgi:hypothetical protein
MAELTQQLLIPADMSDIVDTTLVILGEGTDAVSLQAQDTTGLIVKIISVGTQQTATGDLTRVDYRVVDTNSGVIYMIILIYNRTLPIGSPVATAVTATFEVTNNAGQVIPAAPVTIDSRGATYVVTTSFPALNSRSILITVTIPAAKVILAPSTVFSYIESLAVQAEPVDVNVVPGDDEEQLTINWTTDLLGANLAEMIMAISAPRRYIGGYCSKWIARNRNLRVSDRRCPHTPPCDAECAEVTFFAFRPRIYRTLDGCGDYDLERIRQLHSRYNTPSLEAFYIDVMSYAVLKYCLAGLITGEFDISWLYGSNNAEFFELLANSEFASLLPQFFPYVGYEKYFLWFQ